MDNALASNCYVEYDVLSLIFQMDSPKLSNKNEKRLVVGIQDRLALSRRNC